jgi:hypothetical protein
MSGAKYRPRKVGLEGDVVRYYNILFPVKLIKRIKREAQRLEITGAELVRKAVLNFLKEEK